jgi:Uma2 family endonuclease
MASSNQGIPPLEPGDQLTRTEFERRYEAMPNLKKAELIEGVVYIPSPARHRLHGQPLAWVVGWLGAYEAATPGVEGGINSSVRLDLMNEPQPDALLLMDPARGGQARISPDDFIEGPPELVAEIAASSASYDLHTKFLVYLRNGVREYIVWRTLEKAIDWFILRGDHYEKMAPGEDGVLRSEVFPGLWLDPVAMVHGDRARVVAVLQQGLASPEHADFVSRLASRAKRSP